MLRSILPQLQAAGIRGRTGITRRLIPKLSVAWYSDEIDANPANPSREPTTPVTRVLKRPLNPQDYIVLGAWKAGVMPSRKRPTITQKKGAIDALEQQRKNLLVFMEEENSEEEVFENIDQMKPYNEVVSEKRYAQLLADTSYGYSKAQLVDYFNNRAPTGIARLGKYVSKQHASKRILDAIWKLHISREVSESSDVIIEKTIPLTRREMFVIISENGRLPRSWTKGGAKIIINADEQNIIIRSSADTFDWIQASLHNTLQNSISTDIDTSVIETLFQFDKLPMDRIQRLAQTFLEYSPGSSFLKATAARRRHFDTAKRLIVDALNYKPRSLWSFIYNTPPKNENIHLSRVIDDDTLSWKDRSLDWYRLKRSRRKGENASAQQLDVTDETCENIIQNLKTIAESSSDKPTTLTATFGYVLHNLNEADSKSPSGVTDMPKIFSSNIPFLYDKSSKLSLYDPEADIAHDSSATATEQPVVEQDETPLDAWQKLLDIVDKQSESTSENTEGIIDGGVVHTNRKRLARDDHAYLIQLKFVPNMFVENGAENLKNHPPVEMWFELGPDDKCVMSSIQIASTEQEVNIGVSLPSWECDIKFAGSVSRFLDPSQSSVKKFIDDASIDMYGNDPLYIPKEITLDMNGTPVEYMYSSMTYRRQIDLDYKGYILQLSTLEGGWFGGRRLEANLVLDFPEGLKSIDDGSVEKFTQDAFTFAKSLA